MSNKPRRSGVRGARTSSSTHSPGGTGRQARLETILLQEVQSLIRDEATDPSLEGIVLLSAHLSVDGGHARIAFAVSAAQGTEVEIRQRSSQALERATGFFRARLAAGLNLKKLPRLGFTFIGLAEGGEPCPE